MQGRPKGGKNNYHSKEEKIKIVKEMLDCNLSPLDVEKKYNISHSLAGKWRKDYLEKGEGSIKYPNLINNNWNTTRPLEKITSDTTMILIWFKRQRYDWTYYVDAFDDSIIESVFKPFYHGVNISNHKLALIDMHENKIKRGSKIVFKYIIIFLLFQIHIIFCIVYIFLKAVHVYLNQLLFHYQQRKFYHNLRLLKIYVQLS